MAMLLKELTLLSGPSGVEDQVRDYIAAAAKSRADEVTVDRLGNVIATKRGTAESPATVMVCAHMDEVGFLITRIEDSGLIKFGTTGGIDARILLSQRVKIGAHAVPGVIGSMPIHLLKEDDINKPANIDDMFIDIGAGSKADALKLVKPGDWAVFDSGYVEFGDRLIKAKALDDRAGCSLLLEALEGRYEATLVAVFSVMEEIGGVGASAAAFALNPDTAVVLEGTTCADMHGVPDHLKVTVIGRGPALTVMDNSAISSCKLREYLIATANREQIPWQHRAGAFGGTDAGRIQPTRSGVPVVNINVPCRYIHSPISVMSASDYNNALRLLKAFMGGIQQNIEEVRT
jgi:putative aminopeptidase FrvX